MILTNNRIYTHLPFSSVRILTLCFLIITFGAYFINFCFARCIDQTFQIHSIKISESIGETIDSKTFALEAGYKKAFLVLLKRLTIDGREPRKMPQDYSSLVQNYKIMDERATSHSYAADLHVAFDPKKILSIFNKNGIRYYCMEYDSLLVLYKWGGDITTPEALKWNSAWSYAPAYIGLVHPTIAQNNLEDISELSRLDFMKSKYEDFSSILKKYKVNDIYIIEGNTKDHKFSMRIRMLGKKHDDLYRVIYTNPSYDPNIYSLNDNVRPDDAIGELENDLYNKYHKGNLMGNGYRVAVQDAFFLLDSWWKGDKEMRLASQHWGISEGIKVKRL
ncbi:MAG: hypothetical protein O3C05_01960 [Proteobacteria bacterium]|nr:hypothetical protein [Pseudomonadota bacterium]